MESVLYDGSGSVRCINAYAAYAPGIGRGQAKKATPRLVRALLNGRREAKRPLSSRFEMASVLSCGVLSHGKAKPPETLCRIPSPLYAYPSSAPDIYGRIREPLRHRVLLGGGHLSGLLRHSHPVPPKSLSAVWEAARMGSHPHSHWPLLPPVRMLVRHSPMHGTSRQ